MKEGCSIPVFKTSTVALFYWNHDMFVGVYFTRPLDDGLIVNRQFSANVFFHPVSDLFLIFEFTL